MKSATALNITGIDIHAYLVKDADRAKAFYRDVMGLIPISDVPQGAEYELADGSTFGVWKLDDGPWHPSAGVMFAVTDVAASVDYLKSKGVTVTFGPEEMPSCTMAACEDTEGNSFIIHRRKV